METRELESVIHDIYVRSPTQRRKKRTETPTGTARVRRPHRKWVSSEEAEAVPEESGVRFYRSGGLAHYA